MMKKMVMYCMVETLRGTILFVKFIGHNEDKMLVSEFFTLFHTSIVMVHVYLQCR